MNLNNMNNMNNAKKAQVSFEFMVSMVMGLLVVLALIVLFANKLNEVMQESKDQQIDVVLNILEDEVTFAKGAIAGYSRTFTLPTTVEGNNYSLNLTEGTLYISYFGRDYSRGFSHKVNGSVCLVEINDTTKFFQVERSATEVTLSTCPDCVPNFANCSWNDARDSCEDDLGDLVQECRDRYCLCQ